MKKSISALVVFAALLSWPQNGDAQNYQYPPYDQTVPSAFRSWLQEVGEEAIADGVSPQTVQSALQQTTLDERVVALDRNQPETTLTFSAYSAHTVSVDRVSEGRILLHRHWALLNEIQQRYGVPPEIVLSLWAMESGFGRNSGDYSIVNSLATMAYDGRRAAFFRKELINALHILDEEHMSSSALRGSWAGAMGQPQFMPSTYRRYAVDFDGDGKRDIWNSDADSLASIANYLAAEGWQADSSWGRPVTLRQRLPETEIGLDNKRTLIEWQKLGVRAIDGKPLPYQSLEAALVQPDGLGGRSFLVYDNFRALMRWNHSTYFAASVGLLADKIKAP